MTIGELLQGASTIARVASRVLPGPGAEIAKYLSEALAFGADLSHAGISPVGEIKRIHDMHPNLQNVDKSWRDKFLKKFGEPL